MNIVFLDIDGVISTKESQWGVEQNIKVIDEFVATEDVELFDRLEFFNKDAIKNLNELTEDTGSSIVLSSAWRVHVDMDLIKKMFKHAGIKAEIIGKTPIFTEHGRTVVRGDEIESYVRNNMITNYVVFDDKDFKFNHPERIVRTEARVGLTQMDISKATAILDKKEENMNIKTIKKLMENI